MAGFKGFEEIEGWKDSRKLLAEIYLITKTGGFNSDFGLKDQIRRAAVSAMSNIAEGYEKMGKKEFARFLMISKGSLAEIKSQLYAALDLGYVTKDDFERLYKLADITGKKVYGLYKYLKSKS